MSDDTVLGLLQAQNEALGSLSKGLKRPSNSYVFPAGTSFRTTPQDYFVLEIWNSNPNPPKVAIQGTLTDDNGNEQNWISPVSKVTDTTRGGQTITIKAPNGWFKSLVVVGPSGSLPSRGQMFVKLLFLKGGQTQNLALAYTLSQAYLTTVESPNWSSAGGPFIESPVSGRGYLTSYNVRNATGLGASLSVPTNAIWLLRGIRVTVVTDSTNTTRQAELTFGQIICIPSGTIPASSEKNYSFNPAFGGSTDRTITVATSVDTEVSGFPFDYSLPAAASINVNLFNAGSTDITELYVDVEEFISL